MSDTARGEKNRPRDRPTSKAESASVSGQLILGGLALLLAVIMLAGFYVVTKQAVERAHVHWAQASGIISAGNGCDSATRNAVGGRCQTASGIEIRRVSSGP